MASGISYLILNMLRLMGEGFAFIPNFPDLQNIHLTLDLVKQRNILNKLKDGKRRFPCIKTLRQEDYIDVPQIINQRFIYSNIFYYIMPKPLRFDVHLCVCIDFITKNKLKLLAIRQGQTLSEYIRQILRNEVISSVIEGEQNEE